IVRNLREALEMTPDNHRLRAHLAETLLTAGSASEAADEFKRVLRQAPDDRGSKLGLARAFHAQGQWSAAIVVLEEMHRTGAPDHEVMLHYCRALLKEGGFGKAMDLYEEMLRRWPDRPDAELDEHFRVTGHVVEGEEDEENGPGGELRASDLVVK